MATLNPYLHFKDQARAAMDFYQSVFGGELTRSSFADLPMDSDAADADKIMHSMLVTDGGMTLMAADTPSHMQSQPIAGSSISLSGTDEAELRGYWDKLSDAGTVTVPLEKAPWGDTFGMCVDKFGIPWMVNVVAQ